MEVNIHYLNENQKELTVEYDYISSPFSSSLKDMLLMCIEDKICYLGFKGQKFKTEEEVLAVAKKSFKSLKNVSFIKANLSKFESTVFSGTSKDILLIGTPFQISVWKALLSVKSGEVISYEDLAKRVEGIEKDKNYTRATATAVANNKISLIVPCHRIIRKSGSINQYLWGVDIKKKILEHEGVKF